MLDNDLTREVKLQPDKQDYQVCGFSKTYETYAEACADRRHGAGVLVVIGLAIAALALGIWVFRPSTIYYNRLYGPTFIQYMQAAPHLVMMMGCLFLAMAKKVRGEEQLSRECFLRSRYKIIGIDGNDVGEQVDIRHEAEDDFNISLRPTPVQQL